MFPLFGSAASKSHERSTHDCCCLRTISILAHYMVIFCITKIKVQSNKLLTCTGTVLLFAAVFGSQFDRCHTECMHLVVKK